MEDRRHVPRVVGTIGETIGYHCGAVVTNNGGCVPEDVAKTEPGYLQTFELSTDAALENQANPLVKQKKPALPLLVTGIKRGIEVDPERPSLFRLGGPVQAVRRERL